MRLATVAIVLAGCARSEPPHPRVDPAEAGSASAVLAPEAAPSAPPCDGTSEALAPGLTHERWPIGAVAR